jgi:hypothetical protein
LEEFTYNTHKRAGYASITIIRRVLALHKEGTLPLPVTNKNLSLLALPGLKSATLPQTLYELGMIDAYGSPTATFDQLAHLYQDDPKAFQQLLRDLVQQIYADVFAQLGQNLQGLSLSQYMKAFANYGPVTAQDKMVYLFKGLCQEAGLLAPGRTGLSAVKRSIKRIASDKSVKPHIALDTAAKAHETGVETTISLRTTFACCVTVFMTSRRIKLALLPPDAPLSLTETFQPGEGIHFSLQPVASWMKNISIDISLLVHARGLALDLENIDDSKGKKYEIRLNGNRVIGDDE